MASSAHGRRRAPRPEYWPSFVDVLTNLLLVFIFLLSLFALIQFFLSRELTGRDTMLDQLKAQIAQLNEVLSLERARGQESADTLAGLQANLALAESERSRLQGLLTAQSGAAATAGGQVTALTDQLANEKQISQRALSQVEILNQQIAALRRQIAAIEEALQASESRDRESQAKIADLGSRLNVALAQRVIELQRYRSDFFGRLRQIIGDRPGIRVVGDRFVIQSEVLFPSGSDEINAAGRGELEKIAAAALELQKQIPGDLSWVLRVDGHTDKRPLSGAGRFRNNWDLSAGRAISVVRFMAERGVEPSHLVAAGFGEFQPIEAGDTDDVLARNRRIEFKITER